jgi:hypothetical protein
MFHSQIKVAVSRLQDSDLEGALTALEIAVGDGNHDAVRPLAYLLDRYSEFLGDRLDKWIAKSLGGLDLDQGFSAYTLACIAEQQCQVKEVAIDYYRRGYELGDLRCGMNYAAYCLAEEDLDSVRTYISSVKGQDAFSALWAQTCLELSQSNQDEPTQTQVEQLLAVAEPEDVAVLISTFGLDYLLANDEIVRVLREVSEAGCHRSTTLLALRQAGILERDQNVEEEEIPRHPSVHKLLVLGKDQGSGVCADQLARLEMQSFQAEPTPENFESLITAGLDAAYMGNIDWMLIVLEQAVGTEQVEYAEFWFERIVNRGADDSISAAREILEAAPSEVMESDNTPEYFRQRQSNFVSHLSETDISRTLLVDDSPGSFPIIPILEMDGFVDSVIQRQETAFETIQMWQQEGRWNYLSALGFLLRMKGDHALGIEMLEASGEMGNVHAWFNLGCEPEGLTAAQRETYLRKAVDMNHGGAAYLLAVIATEQSDLAGANEWLIRASKLGDASATRALSQMVSSEVEQLMLAKIADEQESIANPDKDMPTNSANDVLPFATPTACTWENLVALRSANVGGRWWGTYGPSIQVGLDDVSWQVSAAFRSPESESESHAAPVRNGFQQVDAEFVDSPLLQRVSAVCERLGAKLHSLLTPANVDGLLGTWTTPLGIECVQFATAYQDPSDPSSEAVLWQVQLLAYPEHPDILTSINSRSYVGALLETAFYMAETQRPTLNDWLDESTRDIKFGNISNDLAPCPFIRVSHSENVSGFQDGDWTGCRAGLVYSAGYFISSKLTDEQLESVIPAISNALLLVVDILSSATEPPRGVPSLQDLAKVMSLRDFGHASGTFDDADYATTSNPRLRVVSTISADDEVWPMTNGSNPYAVAPDDHQQLASLLQHETQTNPNWINSAAFRTALEAGLLEALDVASIEAERQGESDEATKFYLDGARRGYPQAINNLALDADRLFDDNPEFLRIGLLLSSALCGDLLARRNLRRVCDEFSLPHSESDLLLDADLLNNLGWSVKQELSMAAALPVIEAACRAGSSNALASYLWWALISGETAQGIDMFDTCIALVRERSVTEEAKHQVANSLCNYALLLCATGRDVDALDIARSAEQANNPEALAMPAVISRMRGDLDYSRATAGLLSAEMKAELQEIANDVLTEAHGNWFAQYSLALLEVLIDSDQDSGTKSSLTDQPAFVLKNWARPMTEVKVSAPVPEAATKVLEDLMMAEGLVLKFVGVYNSEGSEASISNRVFFDCSHESHLSEACVACGRDATRIATIQSGYGDGTYAVLEIISGPSIPAQKQTAVGVFVVLDSGVTQSLVELVDERTLEIPLAQLAQITDLPLWKVGTLEKVSDLYISDSGSIASSHSAIVDVSALPDDYQVGMYVTSGDTSQGLAQVIPLGMIALSVQLMQDRGMEIDSPSVALEEIRAGWRDGKVFANMMSGLENAVLLNRSISISDSEYLSWTYQLMNWTSNESLKEQLALEIESAVETGGIEMLETYLASEHLCMRGDYGRVENLLSKLVQDKHEAEELGLTEVWAAAINTFSYAVLIPRGELREARTLLVQAIQQDVGYQSTNAKSNLAILALAENQLDEARDLAIQVMVEEASLAAESREILAKVALLENDPDTAAMYFQENLEGLDVRHKKSAYLQLRALGVPVPSWKAMSW